jgi:general secretion pathway protein D
MSRFTPALLTLLVLAAPLAGQAQAQPNQPPPRPPDATRQMTPLQDLIERIESDPPRQFLIDSRIPPDVFVGGSDLDIVTYPVLLSILRNNNLAAVTIDGIVNITYSGAVRSQPLPIVDPDADDIPGDEWVTIVLRLRNVEAAPLVPIIRPMMPSEAHFAANQGQTLIIVDRFANARRIVEVVRALDR